MLRAFAYPGIRVPEIANTPYVNIRWWINPFKPFMLYHYWFEITGPAGVPDGIVVP